MNLSHMWKLLSQLGVHIFLLLSLPITMPAAESVTFTLKRQRENLWEAEMKQNFHLLNTQV